jgi:hypothetical protein
MARLLCSFQHSLSRDFSNKITAAFNFQYHGTIIVKLALDVVGLRSFA